MKKMLNNKNGITIIALVITIIILLIISTVAITLLVNNNLTGNSKYAVDKYNNATNNENIELSKLSNEIENIDSSRDSIAAANPTGTIISFYGNTAPEGYLVCDGTLYDINQYKSLANLINATLGNYGTEEAGKFAVPDLNEKFLKGSNTAGIKQEAGLPNITGYVGLSLWAYQPNGAFYYVSHTDSNHNNARGTSGTHEYDVLMNASRSSAIYGKSTTVTPENVSVVYCIKY